MSGYPNAIPDASLELNESAHGEMAKFVVAPFFDQPRMEVHVNEGHNDDDGAWMILNRRQIECLSDFLSHGWQGSSEAVDAFLGREKRGGMARDWRLERLREDEMLAFHDAVGGGITQKALAKKFNLKPSRVSLLVRRHIEAQQRERMLRRD